MTGPGEGKIALEAKVVVRDGGERRLEGADVYIHVKGHSLARVTHLDIEHPDLDGLLPAGGGRFLTVAGVLGGIEIGLGDATVAVRCSLLNEVLEPGRRTRTWVGGKHGGIYVGFRKPEVVRLELIASERFGIKPRKYIKEFEE